MGPKNNCKRGAPPTHPLRSYRSRAIERAVLERKLRDIAARGYRSRGPERAVLQRKLRDIAAGSYTCRGPERTVLERAAGYSSRKL